jgi:Uma2 family endonuclease
MELTPDLIEKYEIDEFNKSVDMPSKFHSRLQSKLAFVFNFHYKAQFDVYTELSLNINGKEYIADVCVYPAQEMDWNAEDEIQVHVPPLLAIEILSPKQFIADLKNKFKIYFAWGVKSCWLLEPSTQTIFVQDNQGNQYTYDFRSVLVNDPVLNISFQFDEIFA